MLALISRVQNVRQDFSCSHEPNSEFFQISNPPSSAVQPKEKAALRFGCLGAAKIVPTALATPVKSHSDVVLYAVAARDKARAEEFARKHGFHKSYGGPSGYQDLINDPEVDVIYNPLPNGLHFEWTMKALEGGKHVLLEKPATDTEDEARQIFALAQKKGLVVLEAFHYRFHPSIQRVKAILDSKELGDVKSISAALSAPEGTAKPDDIRWKYELGGGSTMDPGSYTVNVLNYLASPSKPKSILSASAERYSSAPQHKQVDKEFTATVSLENDILGELFSNLNESRILGIIPRFPKLKATVHCEGGTVEIFNFLIPHYYHYIAVSSIGKQSRVEKAYKFTNGSKGEEWWTTYRYQLEAFVDKVRGRKPQTWVEPQETITNMRLIEEIYAKDGFGSRPQSNYEYHDE
ncbi:NAD(P)-binding protein [Lentinula aff. detonsa]|uniref:D-xylose 1-dehydrogenase (NADP(+), D-xylono-1,5-lactone-forming) n=1 Tax=Lentinula aff. detonsa TaxID=2804958 RepID=A0AA38NP20_9AGAR|nr:NAD(P)-binding protein [Lentinula aff. detonsa]